ncbi:tetratricopeptide repeat protein [Streptomyces anulatus]|uniref:tetratricopeptide repeat protein n=1 Tax=Streptomyces anulatus TaxID=1892 RepID=UPI0038665041|nr:tetratricopeptide repeat protein [Streptomyces anulatus]
MTTQHPLTEQSVALHALGRNNEAKELLARRLAEDSEDGAAWVQLARCHLSSREFEEVIRTTAEALRIAPDDWDALVVRTYGLRRTGRRDEALAAAQECVRLAPQSAMAHVALSEALMAWRERMLDSVAAAEQAVRLNPEYSEAYYALWKSATFSGRPDAQEIREFAVRQTLRLDPEDAWAVEEYAGMRAAAPGVCLPAKASAYADALAASPDSTDLRARLDQTVFRMLRGTRWLAVLSLCIAGVLVDLFPTEGETPKELPLPLGMRLYALFLMAVAWGLGALLRYRSLRQGARLSLQSLLRRMFWARLVLAQAVWGTLFAVVITLVPWSGRGIPQVLFWTGLIPVLLTIWFDRPRKR